MSAHQQWKHAQNVRMIRKAIKEIMPWYGWVGALVIFLLLTLAGG